MASDTHTIKVSAENYKAICEFAGELQKSRGTPVSVDRAVTELLKKKSVLDLAGSWKMNDTETNDLLQSIKQGWRAWKPSA